MGIERQVYVRGEEVGMLAGVTMYDPFRSVHDQCGSVIYWGCREWLKFAHHLMHGFCRDRQRIAVCIASTKTRLGGKQHWLVGREGL